MHVTLAFLMGLAANTAASAVLFNSEKTLLPTYCENSPSSRHCWGRYDVDTDYYKTVPETGHTVEVWLSADEVECSPDGYRRPCLVFNGTVPGPTITADWGDTLVVHVTNNLRSNGTSVHWHGVRQLQSIEQDGVPGITQCPIEPGASATYRFRVTQYGTSWYHSHFSLQYSEGLFGGLVFRGPATADYDDDMGHVFLHDWSHTPVFAAWSEKTRYGITHSLDNLLINGTNTFCADTGTNGKKNNNDDRNGCIGSKFETTFSAGRRHLLRIVNVATDGHFQFSIDGHRLRVLASDFVPIEPYETDSIVVSAAQRYDVVVVADAAPASYWMRAGWVGACAGVANDHPDSATGIVRYDTAESVEPNSTSTVVVATTCEDEPAASLVPRLALDVTNMRADDMTVEDVNVRLTSAAWFQWTINSSSLVLDWARPTLQRILNNETLFPTPYNVVAVDKSSPDADEWAVVVIENKAAAFFGAISHPIHLHGHDFWVLAQEGHPWDGSTSSFRTRNPPRRDTARLPAHGYLAIAFKLDNPGTWILHCHIAWHASQGLALELVESRNEIALGGGSAFDGLKESMAKTCASWSKWWQAESPYPQEDSGI